MIANHKGEIPVVILLLPFLLGIWVGLCLLPGTNVLWLESWFFSLCVLFVLLNLSYARLKLYKNRWVGGALITLILVLFGWISVIFSNELNNDDHFSKQPAQYLVVKINNEPVLKNGLVRFTADVEESIDSGKKHTASGTLLVTIKDTAAKNLYYGDELLIPAKYNPVEPPLTPAAFNYKRYLANQNVYYQAYFNRQQFRLLATGTGNPIIEKSLRLRQHLVEKLKVNMRDTDAIAVASTLILGYKADLSNDVLQAYSKTGTVHVLSVSGAHVAILYILLAFAFGFLDRYKHGKLIKAFLIVTIIWYYALLSGFSPAVCRAAVMISMVIIGKTYNRYINTLNIMAISAFLLLVYNPMFITDVGFQLSYLAVFGLIVLQPVVYKWFTFKNKWADKLWALCSVSIAAQVITFPLSAFYFHQFPVYFLISNLFIIIPSALIMYSGILYLVLPQIPVVSHAIAFILEKTIVIMNKGLTIIEHSPYASINKIWLTTFEYLLLYVIIIGLFYFLYDRKKWLLKLTLSCMLLLCISFSIKQINQSATNSIAWLNLNKHKGIVFKNGDEAVVLSDVKYTDKTWLYSIQPYLDSCQVSRVKLVTFDQDISIRWLVKKGDFIQFLNKTVFLYDRQLQQITLPQKLKADYIYVTGNPFGGLSVINSNFDYKALVVDGTNSDKFTAAIEKLTNDKKHNFSVLKRNNSLISFSN